MNRVAESKIRQELSIYGPTWNIKAKRQYPSTRMLPMATSCSAAFWASFQSQVEKSVTDLSISSCCSRVFHTNFINALINLEHDDICGSLVNPLL